MGIFLNAKKELTKLEKMQEHCRSWYRTIQGADDSLHALLSLHKHMWKDGMHHPNFGPNSSSMFRTENIETMKPEEVYLGEVYGIWRNNIPFFERDEIKYENLQDRTLSDTYTTICRQYRNHLLSNIRAMESKIFDDSYNRDKICKALSEEIFRHTGKTVLKMTVTNKRMQNNKLHQVEFELSGGRKVISDILIYLNCIYYPCNIEKGVNLNPKSIQDSGLYMLGGEDDCQHIITCGKIKWDNEPERLTRKDIRELRNNIRTLNGKGITYVI